MYGCIVRELEGDELEVGDGGDGECLVGLRRAVLLDCQEAPRTRPCEMDEYKLGGDRMRRTPVNVLVDGEGGVGAAGLVAGLEDVVPCRALEGGVRPLDLEPNVS